MIKTHTRLLHELEQQYGLAGVTLQSAFLYAFGLGELMTSHFDPANIGSANIVSAGEISYAGAEEGGAGLCVSDGTGSRSLAELFGLDYLDVERLAGTGYSFSDLVPEIGPDAGPYDFVSLQSLLAESSDLEELLDCTLFQRSPAAEAATLLVDPAGDFMDSQEHVVVQISSLHTEDFDGSNLLHQLILTQSS